MKQINFIPESVQQHDARQRLIVATVFSLALGIVAVGVVWISLKASIEVVQGGKSMNGMNSPSPSPKTGADSAHAKALMVRVIALNELAKTEINWKRAFLLADSLVPRDTRLTGLVLSEDATHTTIIHLTGGAPSNLSFATFWQSLQVSPLISALKSEGYSYSPAKGTVSFSLSGQIPTNKIDFSAP